MNATLARAKAITSHRLAMPLRVDRTGRFGIEYALGELQIANEKLIPVSRGDAGEPHLHRYPPARMEHAGAAASRWPNPGFGQGDSAVMRHALKRFFCHFGE
jgi:hypothetical protein